MRQSGYYWVRSKKTWLLCKWYHASQCWRVFGSLDVFYDKDFDEINENRLIK